VAPVGLSDVAWSPDGRSIATAGEDGARIFDASTGAFRFALLGEGGPVQDVDWSPDASRLVTANSDGTARVWRLTDEGPRQDFTLSANDTRDGVAGVAFSPDGMRVLTGDFTEKAASVWDVGISGDAEVAKLPAVATTYGAVAFTPDGRGLVGSSAAGSVALWDARTFSTGRTLGAAAGASAAPARGPAAASGADVFSVDVSPDGRLVAAARIDGSVRVWDAETGQEAFTVDPGPTVFGGPYMDVAWSPDGDVLAVAANDGLTGRVTIVDPTGEVQNVLPEETGFAVGSVAFTPDEQLVTTRIPTIDSDRRFAQVVIRDWRTRKKLRTIGTPEYTALAGPTGHLLATTSWDQGSLPGGTVDVWDSASGRRIAHLDGSRGVVGLAFSPDGSRLATGSQDGTVALWDARSGERLLVLRGPHTLVSSVAFDPDGSRLASVGADGVVRVWALDLDDLTEIARHEVQRHLTAGECRQYLHRQHCA
jgi:WD40 repeat protein